MKAVLLEILKRSGLLAGSLALGSLGVLLAARANLWETILGVVLTPVLGVLVRLANAYFKNKGKLTVAEVDATFDEADPQ